MSSKGQRKGKRQPKPRPKQAAPAVQPKTPHPIRTTLKVLSALVVAGMILYLAISWGSIPDQVPTTFDANGEPLAFTSRSYLLACPILGGLLCLMVTIMANDTRVWRLPFKVKPESRKIVDSIMNNVMVLLTLEIEIVFTLLTISMAAFWNPGGTVMAGSLAAVVATVVGGTVLAYLANGGKDSNSGQNNGPFNAPPNTLGGRRL